MVNEPIAIIGIGCRFPGGVDGPEKFWRLLVEGVDAITEIPPGRWNVDAFYDPVPGRIGKSISRWGGFVDSIDQFDPGFFGISPREAASMDPQHRMLLQTAWEALEDGGVKVTGGIPAGVFVGISTNDYGNLQYSPGDNRSLNSWTATGTVASIAANQISYCLDLRGPSFVVDTACSSSMVALHLACTSLWDGTCPLALVGGVNALLMPAAYVIFSRSGMLSPDGRCKAFDARANGLVRAEGAGVIALKPLSAAIADGNPIYAVIRGTAINQAGRTNGISLPSVTAQEALVREACARAGVAPGEVAYIEAHGTGTPVGDPIECAALAASVGVARSAQNPCVIGSVKTNIGHLEAGAGVAGIIKTALSLHHGQIPPTVHFQTPNPSLDLAGGNLRIARKLEPFPSAEKRPIAGVNSFGFGGANAHAILQAPPLPAPPDRIAASPTEKSHLLTLSARSEAALRDLAAKYLPFLAAKTVPLANTCFTAGAYRTAHRYRLAVAAANSEALQEKLAAFIAGENRAGLSAGHSREESSAPVFVFSGQGPQWWAMGRELLVEEPVFRQRIEECDRLIRTMGDWSLLEELRRDEASSRMHDTAVAQPAIFSLQMGLVALWQSWGIHPAAVVGHSVGEAAAACTAGVLTLQDAMHTIFQRGRCMSLAAEEGRMLAVGLPLAEAEALLEGHGDGVSIGSINSPRSVVLSGNRETLEKLAEAIAARGIFCRFLPVRYAFHSQQMDPIREQLFSSLGKLVPHLASVPLFSTVTGEALTGDDFGTDYWWRNVRQPVRFAAVMESLLARGHQVFLEVGPHPVLGGSMLECLSHRGCSGTVLSSLRRKEPERETLLGSLGALHVLGNAVDWKTLYPAATAIRLPTYAWQNERYWHEAEDWTAARRSLLVHPLLDRTVKTAMPTWQTALDLEALPWLRDHRVQGRMVFPAAGYMEMCFAAGTTLFKGKPVVAEDLEIQAALFLPESEKAVCLQWSYDPRESSIAISSTRDGTTWTTHAVGRLTAGSETDSVTPIEELRVACTEEVSGETVRQKCAEAGLLFGPSFAGNETLYRRDGEALGRIVLPAGVDGENYLAHPCLVDACLQVIAYALPGGLAEERRLFLPVRVDRVRFFARPSGTIWGHARLVHFGGKVLVGNIDVLDEQGRLLIAIEGYRLQAVSSGNADKRDDEDWCYEFQWRPDSGREVAEVSNEEVKETPPRTPATWLIFADRSGAARALAGLLAARGDSVISVFAGLAYLRREATAFEVRPESGDDLQQLFAEIRASNLQEITGVVHLWNLDASEPAALDATTLARAEEEGCYSLLPVLQVLAKERTLPRLWLITRGAQAVKPADPVSVAQAPIWGVGRVLFNELPKLRCRLVDLPPVKSEHDAMHLLEELEIDDREEEVAYRKGVRQVHRLARLSPAQLPSRAAPAEPAASYRLELGSFPGVDQLAFHARPSESPGAGEVTIEVQAVGLNFRDVMKALGIYPSEDDADSLLGDECAGRIVAVGEGVEKYQVGDEVAAMTPGCFASHLTLPAAALVRKPNGLGFDEAATIPVAFLSAWYALHHLGRLREGERVLIQAAAGGVGLAAVQVAQLLGAEIFATAGSPEKRELLHSLGIRHVMDSRSLAFADEVRALTGGRGVDVVLNSLSGEAIAKGISCLAPGGRFLEIGKRDIYQNAKLGLRPFRNNLAFFAIDLAQVLRDEPALVQAMLREVMAHVTAGRLRPLPMSRFPMPQIREAFRHMSQARHIGKIVITRDAEFRVLLPPPIEAPLQFKADASYLITGGLSGFGLAVAEWMLRSGAKHLILVGRSGSSNEAAQEVPARLRELGGEIVAVTADVTCAADVDRIFDTIAERLPPLRGIVHSAMVIDDSTLLNQSGEQFRRVMAPKVTGAWNLHTRTANLELDFFVLFSSVSALIGNSGQSSYAAANCFLDALAHHRHACGLPALVVNWGMLSDVGYVSRTAGLEATLRMRGLSGFTAAEATAILGRLLQSTAVQVGVFRLHWRKGADSQAALANSPRFAELFTDSEAESTSSDDGAIAAILALPESEQLPALTKHLAGQTAYVLRASAARLDVHCPLNELGFDSLMSIELMNRVEMSYKVSLPLGAIDSSVSVSKLAATLLGILTGTAVTPALPPVSAIAFPQIEANEETTAPDSPADTSLAASEILAPPPILEEVSQPPSPTEKNPPSKALRARFYFEWLALRGLLACFRAGDFQRARKRLHFLTPVMTRVLRHDWRWAVQNLKLIFGPNLTNKEREDLATLAFEHHLSSYLEGMRHKDLEVDFHHYERLTEIHAEGRGVILCGVHLGSWESVLHYGARVGLPIVGVYRPAFNPRSDQVFQEIRSAYHIEWVVSKDAEAISNALRAGKVVGLMTDLNTLSGGTIADFLGVPATCPSGPARLALLLNVPIVTAVAVRNGAGRISAHFEAAIRPPRNDNSSEQIAQLTRKINTAFEPWIREYAEQYNWLHPRWRARPDGGRWSLQTSAAEFEKQRTAPFLAVPERVRQLLNSKR